MDWGWAAAVFTFLAGQLAVIGVEWTRHWMQRDQRRRDARDDLQRQTLINLQEVLARYYRGARNTLMTGKNQLLGKPLGAWHKLEDPNELSAGAVSQMMVLASRVDDDEVRNLVVKLVEIFDQELPDEWTVEAIDEFMARVRDTHQAVNDRIGELLRAF